MAKNPGGIFKQFKVNDTYLRRSSGFHHSGAYRNPDTTQAEIMEFGIVDASELLKP
jgi:hypothetical protein